MLPLNTDSFRSTSKLAQASFLLVLVLALFLSFHNLGTGANFGHGTGIDESWYIQTIQEMRMSGRWWLPTREGEPFFYKPPLKFWLVELVLSVVPESMVAHRLLDAALGSLFICATYFIGAVMFSSTVAGFFAALALMGCNLFLFNNGVRYATLDTLLITLGSAVLLLIWKYTETNSASIERNRQLKLGALIGLLVGLNVLNKSVAGYYPFMIAGAWIVLSGRLFWTLKERFWFYLAMGIVSVAIPACWFVPHALWTPGAYERMVGYEIVGRFSKGFHHAKDRLFYWNIFLHNYTFPPLVALGALLFGALMFRTNERRKYAFLILWVVLPFMLYSKLHSRLPWYIAPCYLPMALLIGAAISKLWSYGRNHFNASGIRKSIPISSIVLAALCVVQLGLFTYKNAQAVMLGSPRLDIDRVTDAIRRDPRWGTDQKFIFILEPLKIATREQIFYNMFDKNIVRVTTLDDLFKAAKDTSGAFVITHGHAREILHTLRMTYYRQMRPVAFDQGPTASRRLHPATALTNADLTLEEAAKLGFKPAAQADLPRAPKSE
ncbi:MAG: glycosyltransferase family 39 protein [Oligoflexia bacterium]|nr:glycosyltransferase family 39 protein [Oligoflexia bacterium]